MFVEVVGVTKSYKKFVDDNNFLSEKGNRQSSAEVAYRFLVQNPDFIEDHTALSDVLIEVHILAECLAKNKKYTKVRIGQPWKLIQG